jgi:hypothetical protein
VARLEARVGEESACLLTASVLRHCWVRAALGPAHRGALAIEHTERVLRGGAHTRFADRRSSLSARLLGGTAGRGNVQAEEEVAAGGRGRGAARDCLGGAAASDWAHRAEASSGFTLRSFQLRAPKQSCVDETPPPPPLRRLAPSPFRCSSNPPSPPHPVPPTTSAPNRRSSLPSVARRAVWEGRRRGRRRRLPRRRRPRRRGRGCASTVARGNLGLVTRACVASASPVESTRAPQIILPPLTASTSRGEYLSHWALCYDSPYAHGRRASAKVAATVQ